MTEAAGSGSTPHARATFLAPRPPDGGRAIASTVCANVLACGRTRPLPGQAAHLRYPDSRTPPVYVAARLDAGLAALGYSKPDFASSAQEQ